MWAESVPLAAAGVGYDVQQRLSRRRASAEHRWTTGFELPCFYVVLRLSQLKWSDRSEHWLAAELAITCNPSQLRRLPDYVAHCHLGPPF